MRSNWSEIEIEIIVKDYFKMLSIDLQEQSYSKTYHRNNIISSLNNRSHGSVEFKHQNISAVLIYLGLPYISGYKPRSNFQALLKEVVEDFLNLNPSYFELFNNYLNSETVIPNVIDILSRREEKPVFEFKIKEPSVSYQAYPGRTDYYQKEFTNKRIGILGEKFVVNFEKARLIKDGFDNLADKVEHISQTFGDSAGYDVLSFDPTGKDRYIEVKTTKLGKDSPFFITRNELNFSELKNNSFFLYRVFKISADPRLYFLNGSMTRSCNLEPSQYIGWPQ